MTIYASEERCRNSEVFRRADNVPTRFSKIPFKSELRINYTESSRFNRFAVSCLILSWIYREDSYDHQSSTCIHEIIQKRITLSFNKKKKHSNIVGSSEKKIKASNLILYIIHDFNMKFITNMKLRKRLNAVIVGSCVIDL